MWNLLIKDHGGFLLVKAAVVFDQQVRHLPRRDLDAHIAQQLGHLGFAHLRPIIEDQRQALDPGTELPMIARRQGG